jgi:ATP:cob(I)alamin adenosyltransferase
MLYDDKSMTVNLTRIYTRLGDGGETHLGDMSRVPKTDARIEAYGTVDELNAQIGVALTVPGIPHPEWLRRIQNDLFDVGADISVPAGGERERLRVIPEQTAWLEQACDEANEPLAPLKSFVLPGGTPETARLAPRSRWPGSGTLMSAPTSKRSFWTRVSQRAVRSLSAPWASATPSWALSSSTVP